MSELRMRPPEICSVQRLNTHQVIVVIHVPDRHWFRGSVNDSSTVVGIRLGHLINPPMSGLRIESKHLPAMQDTRPNLAIPVGHGFVEIGIWMRRNRRPEFFNPRGFRIELDESAIPAAPPRISERIKAAALGSHHVRAAIQVEYFP